MTTARDIIEGAGRLIGVVRKSEALSADEAADGLESLNDMLGSWSNESLLVYARTWEGPFTLNGAASYLIGAGQTFNTVKPTDILEAYLRQGTLDTPLTIITDEEFQRIGLKTTQTLGRYLNYDNGHPYGKIRIYPQSTTETLFLLTEKPLTSIADLNTTIDLPTGWNKALKYNLSMDMAPEYGITPDPLVVIGAAESKMNIKKAVIKNRKITFDDDFRYEPNIYNGGF